MVQILALPLLVVWTLDPSNLGTKMATADSRQGTTLLVSASPPRLLVSDLI
jgi:hypothetical protein